MENVSFAPRGARNFTLMTAILCWTGLIVMSGLYVTIPLIPLFADHFAITMTAAALPGTAFSFGFAAGCLIYGAVSDRFGRKRVISVGLVSLTLITLALGAIDSYAWFCALRGLQGAAAATFSPVALAYAVEMFPPPRRVAAIGFISTGFLVAGIAGQVGGSWVSGHYDWHAVFYGLSVLYAATALLVYRLLPQDEVQRPNARILEPLRQIGGLLRRPPLVLGYVIAFVLLMSFVSMYIVLGSYVSGPRFGLSTQELLYVRSAGVLGMLLSPTAGWLSNRLGVHMVLRGGLLLAVVSMALLGLLPSLALLIAASVLYVAGIALAVPALVALIGQLGGKQRGVAVSCYTFVLFAGTSAAPVLSIALMKSGSYALTFGCLAAVLGVGLASSLLVRPGRAAGAHVGSQR